MKAAPAEMIKALKLGASDESRLLTAFQDGPPWMLKQYVLSGKIQQFPGIGPAKAQALQQMLKGVEIPEEAQQPSLLDAATADDHSQHLAPVGLPEPPPPAPPPPLPDSSAEIFRVLVDFGKQFQQAVLKFEQAVGVLTTISQQQQELWQWYRESGMITEKPAQAPRKPQDTLQGTPVDYPGPGELSRQEPQQAQQYVPPAQQQEKFRQQMWATAAAFGWNPKAVKGMAAKIAQGEDPAALSQRTWNAILETLEMEHVRDKWHQHLYLEAVKDTGSH